MTAMTMPSVRPDVRQAARNDAEHVPAPEINVGREERLLSLLAGGTLAAFGLTRGTTKGLVLAGIGAALAYRGATGHCSMYQALGLSSAGGHMIPHGQTETTVPARRSVRVEESITILRSPGELFAFWRRFENLPRIMPHLISVTEENSNRSHWVAKGVTGQTEWDAEIINERPNELIAWRSVDGSEVATAGSVRFQQAPGNRGTEVHVEMDYIPPAGRAGAAIAWLAGRDAQTEIREDLRTFKRIMETGTVPTTAGQSHGSCRWL